MEIGLRYSNNDICFPATVVIGDIIKALQSGRYPHQDIAIGITQTGGQCRASSYLSLIRKAIIAAGYHDIPVISVTLAKGLNDQPGFEIDWLKHVNVLFFGTIGADCLAKLYYATVTREQNRGESKQLHQNYLNKLGNAIAARDCGLIPELVRQAVADFNKITVHEGECPKIGIVGEIYVKYNSFGHQGIIDWLINQGIEVCVPPILDFFTQDFVNVDVNNRNNLRKAKISDILIKGLELYTEKHQAKINQILADFRFHTPFHGVRDIALKASRILDLVNQFGEGWLIAAEVASFADAGINNVVSLQPFGCIANHVVSKGIETRIKELYPEMNLLFLDFEAGTSEVNILNRLHFMIRNTSHRPAA